MKMFVYNPNNPDSNQNGIVEYDILCATIRLTGDDKGLVRFILDKNGFYFHIDDVDEQTVDSDGFLPFIEGVLSVNEGEEFRGWNNTKQYRLTEDEIKSFVMESQEKIEGGTKTFYKVFAPCSVKKVLPSKVTGNKQKRGYLIK